MCHARKPVIKDILVFSMANCKERKNFMWCVLENDDGDVYLINVFFLV